MKKILIINGHPCKESLCSSLFESYIKGASSANFQIEKIVLSDLIFDPILRFSSAASQSLEEDLKKSQFMIDQADHIVIVTPNWWGGFPALLKGFIDRVFTNGFAYDFNKFGIPSGLFKKKSITLIYTQGKPYLLSLFTKDYFFSLVKKEIFEFCGFSKINRKVIYGAKKINKSKYEKIVEEIFLLGRRGL